METESPIPTEEAIVWLESALPRVMRRLLDSENLDMPLFQLPLAQMRLAHALYHESEKACETAGETMGHLSERLGVRHNALTQAADRLINHGLAERNGDPNDRRIVRLRLTEKGRAWVYERKARRRAHLSQLWALLTSEEREEVLQAVRTLEAAGMRLDAQRQAHEEEGN
jgi:DNA-binding MarR family transcriptional regulator